MCCCHDHSRFFTTPVQSYVGAANQWSPDHVPVPLLKGRWGIEYMGFRASVKAAHGEEFHKYKKGICTWRKENNKRQIFTSISELYLEFLGSRDKSQCNSSCL